MRDRIGEKAQLATGKFQFKNSCFGRVGTDRILVVVLVALTAVATVVAHGTR